MSQLNELIIPITLAIMAILSLSLFILIVFFIIPMRARINELSRIMYTILRKDEKYDNAHDSIKHALLKINDDIGSLSSSTNKVLEQTIKQKIPNNMPTPEMSKQIRDTIMENINIEVLMSKDMRVPNRESIFRIIENTVRTYPEIDLRYIVKLSLSMVENYILSVNEEQEAIRKHK